MEHDRRWARNAQRSLRTVLNEWDPLGVQGAQDDGGPHDEYDCILGPLITLLLQGADGHSVEVYLRTELDEHFGLVDQVTRGAAVACARLSSRRRRSTVGAATPVTTTPMPMTALARMNRSRLAE